ncbi:MAG: pantoate--beta-alanine ligase [Bacteroidales bacterium]|nr:pantoate--beta-alanine ligase [Bacteroidales bacterium]
MKTVNTISETRDLINSIKIQGKTVGFVPTMGALHDGHITLIREARKENNFIVCSIFVNPIQFNNPNDLKNYPREIEKDIKKLVEAKCDLLFHPSVEEMYPEPDNTIFDFGDLDKVMEGAFRPGHFNGVAVVVKKLFEIVTPHRAYFGMKDYQQLVIIHQLTKDYEIPVEIVPCTTVREKDGLAMSSRNQLLSKSERKIAPIIYETLKLVKVQSGYATISELKDFVHDQFRKHKNMKLEYFEIVDMYTLKSIRTWADSRTAIACIAVYLGNVRLIDNIILFS